MYEFPSEEGGIGPFVSKDFLWLKYRLFPLMFYFSAICSECENGLTNRHVMQSWHNTFIQIGAIGKYKF